MPIQPILPFNTLRVTNHTFQCTPAPWLGVTSQQSKLFGPHSNWSPEICYSSDRMGGIAIQRFDIKLACVDTSKNTLTSARAHGRDSFTFDWLCEQASRLSPATTWRSRVPQPTAPLNSVKWLLAAARGTLERRVGVSVSVRSTKKPTASQTKEGKKAMANCFSGRSRYLPPRIDEPSYV